ncbi:hypothetical protein DESUT3_17150 [Desulfuromonas versatilis]|uniref:PilY1 beta-propeller domain-containing protein n=1 Tax=Desulfuromonas versatilis TaxID=2802975 RepID=A0ABM8HRW5_9BACT|nr:PilC/PilY family type IV pilus protein [Desulfuromonas versatilis]BCR04646.1 hypothetical protein DESUT3_17150 [Desulfuromonas versatilis]
MKRLGLLFGGTLLVLLGLTLPAEAALRTFATGSVIVPMDPCWQPNSDNDVDNTYLHASCDSVKNDQGIFQAYGMVYTLLRKGIPVYWTIAQKTSVHGVDFTINGGAGAPVLKYGSNTPVDPAARTVAGESFSAHVIEYRGGPFVIDKKDLNTDALAVLNNYANVKKHVSQVDFTAPVEKTLASLPPKIAVLGQGATDVLQDYLIMSGLGFQTNVVYDVIPPSKIIDGTLANEYQLFWAPHWIIEDEINNQAERELVMLKLREFLESGNSAFLECASLESVEGSPKGGVDSSTQKYGGWLTKKDYTIPRIEINAGSQDQKYMTFDDSVSFLTQCGGWKYDPKGGHVHNFRPAQQVPYLYNNSVTRLAHDQDGAHPPGNPNIPGFDYYVGGRINGSATQGYVSFLAGHSYGKCQGNSGGSGNGTVDFVLDVQLKKGINSNEYIDITLNYGGNQALTARYYRSGTIQARNGATLTSKQVHDATLGIELKDATWKSNDKEVSGILIVNKTTGSVAINSVTITFPSSADELKGLDDANSASGKKTLCSDVKNSPATCSVNYNMPGTAGLSEEISSCNPVWGNTNTCGMRYVLNTVLGLQFTLVSNEFVESSPILDGRMMYAASFEFPGHKGHLRAIDLLETDPALRNKWDAAQQVPPAGTGAMPATPSKNNATRHLFTNNASFVKVGFDATDTQANLLKADLGKTDLNEAKALINSVRGRFGASAGNVGGTGEMSHRLWGITTSTPAVIGGSGIIGAQQGRDRIVYVGAEDGMLHAFYGGSWDGSAYGTGTGSEVWAYIPSKILPHLKNQPFNDPNQAAVVNVDGSPAVGDFFIDPDGNGLNEWHTVLVGTASVQSTNLGIFFALDITDPYAPKVLWEKTFPNDNVGNSKGVAIGSVQIGDTTRSYVFLTSTYSAKKPNSSGSYGINALALDLVSGNKVWQFSAPYSGTVSNVNEVPALPALMGLDQQGTVTKLVFGDMAGQVWALDPKTGQSIHRSNNQDLPVYTVPGGAPIGGGVAVFQDKVVFGTGGANFASDNATYGVYAINVGDSGSASLLWKLDLNQGEKVWSPPTIDSQGNIFLSTAKGFNKSLNPDSQGTTSGRLLILDMNNSGSVKRSVDIEGAGLGNVEVGDGVAVAISFDGKVTQIGSPQSGGGGGGEKAPVRVFSWRLR